MTDIHTHILPAMDDGCQTVEESLRLLKMEWEQRVDVVYLTPHFYPEREAPEEFLRRRARSFDDLRAALPAEAPELFLGAEVAWFPTLAHYPGLETLTLGGSGYFLLELPFSPWSNRLMDGLYQLPDLTGLTPVLAHVERYAALQGKKRMNDLLSLGLPMQMNASFITKNWRKALPLLAQGEWAVASDCHNEKKRPPELSKAASILRDKMGSSARYMFRRSPVG